MATPQPAQKARSELLSVSFDLPVARSTLDCSADPFSHPLSRACVRTCHQVISFLQKHGIRLGNTIYPTAPTRTHVHTPEYHWTEFWRAVLGLLEFLTKKIDELQGAAGIRTLIKEVSTLTTLQFPSKLL